MPPIRMLSVAEIEAGLEPVRQSPRSAGVLELIVCRPAPGRREVLAEGRLDPLEGLLGDGWRTRGSKLTDDGSPHPDMQLTIINARAIALIAQDKARWPLAGDQLFVDFDLSVDNLAPGARLAIGTAIVEMTALAHLGCKLFANRYGADAVRAVNSPVGRSLRLRGINAKVIEPGTIRPGDAVLKLA